MAQQHQIGSHRTNIFQGDGYTCVKYHNTNVVKFNDNKIVLNSGGWWTPTTKNRMNQTSNQFGLGFRVFQKDFVWFVDYQGATIKFGKYNMILSRKDGDK